MDVVWAILIAVAAAVIGVIIGYFYSPKKTLAKLMIDETIERRSKEENQKLIAAKKDD